MLKNLKYLNRRGLNLNSSSSLVIFDKSLAHLSLKPQPQLQIEFRRMFSSANKGPENKGPDNNEFKDSEFGFRPVEEKIWESPAPLVFKNGEMRLYETRNINKNLNIILYSLQGSLTLFSGYELYDFGNRTWYGALFYFLLGGASLLTWIGAGIGYSSGVYDLRLLNDGKRIKIATLKAGLKPTWEIIEINKIQETEPSKKRIKDLDYFTVGTDTFFLPEGQVSNVDVLKAVLKGYNIDTYNFEEETTVKS